MSGVRKLSAGSVRLGAQPRSILDGSRLAEVETSSEVVDGYRQGYQEGYEAGEADARTEVERRAKAELAELEASRVAVEDAIGAWRDRTKKLAPQFEEGYRTALAQVERLASEIALTALERILGARHADRVAVTAACRKTLADLKLESVRVRVHPDDAEGLSDIPGVLEVIADESMSRGDLLLHSALGDIDAGPLRQLARLREALSDESTAEAS